MKKAAVLLADGLEEIEAITAVDLLRRAQVDVRTVSISQEHIVHGSHGIPFQADALLKEIPFAEYDMLVLPGGAVGTENLANHPGVRNVIEGFAASGKYIGAICMAPTILGKMGLLKDRHVTCYPLAEEMLSESVIQKAPVVQDQNIITGRGVGAAIDFSLKLIEVLTDQETAGKIAGSILHDRSNGAPASIPG